MEDIHVISKTLQTSNMKLEVTSVHKIQIKYNNHISKGQNITFEKTTNAFFAVSIISYLFL